MNYAARCGFTCECGREYSWVKIGYSEDPEWRVFRELQTGNPLKITILATGPGGKEEESAMHLTHAVDRVRGEWFNPTNSVMDTVRSMNEFRLRGWKPPPMPVANDTTERLRRERAEMARGRV